MTIHSANRIETIQQMAHILPEAQKDPDNTLVMFDIGYTLIQPTGPMLGTAEGRKYLLSQYSLTERQSREALIQTATELTPLMHWSPVEATIPGLIQRLQQQSIATLAITGAGNHFIFKWPYYPKKGAMDQFQLYSSLLKRNGIDLTKSAPEGEELGDVCDYLSAKYHEGILFTCGQPMSNILPHFLNAMKYQKFLIVDDELDFLEQLAEALKAYPIEFIGYHYCAGKPLPFDAGIAEVQLNHFQKTHQLITDEEAAGMQAMR